MFLLSTGLLTQLPAELIAEVQQHISCFDSVVTAPYDTAEVQWLGHNAKNFYLFSSSEDGRRCEYTLCEGGGEIAYKRARRSYRNITFMGEMRANIDSEIEHRWLPLPQGPLVYMGKDGLSDRLVGRHGPEVFREYAWDTQQYGKLMSTTILLDIHSYFTLIRRRLESLGHAHCTQDARKRTADYLTSITIFYSDRCALLEAYLLSSLHLHTKSSLQVVKDACEYGYVNDRDYMARIADNCEKYKQELLTVIAQMQMQ